MSKRHSYHPSETHLALHPASNLISCPCGVRFQPRPESVDGQDDPELCLSCNRSRWSRLWNDNQPVENKGEVVSMVPMIDRRPRR